MDQITSGEAIEIYKKMLDLQSSNHNTAITILLGISALLLGVTWWWNWRGVKQYLGDLVQKKIQNERVILIGDMEKEIEQKLTGNLQRYEQKLKGVEAEVYRSIGVTASLDNHSPAAIWWLSQALRIWIDLGSEKMIGRGVSMLKKEMLFLRPSITNRPRIMGKQDVLKIISQIPDIIEDEKKFLSKNISEYFDDEESEEN